MVGLIMINEFTAIVEHDGNGSVLIAPKSLVQIGWDQPKKNARKIYEMP